MVHPLTKYLGGRNTTLGGVIVDSGKFPWAEHKARFWRLNEPDVSYHGVVCTEALGPVAYIGRARVVPLRNMGAALSAMTAGSRFLDALRLFTRLVNIGDAKSLGCRPASTTHCQLNPAELARAGVSLDMVHLSAGTELIDDLLADL